MKIKSVKNVKTPGYPSRRQFHECGRMLGAAAIGLSTMVAGCRAESGPAAPAVEIVQLGGVVAPEPVQQPAPVAEPTPAPAPQPVAEPQRLPGKPAVEPTPIPTPPGEPIAVTGDTATPVATNVVPVPDPVVLGGVPMVEPPTSNVPPADVVTMAYKVQQGDTLTGIAYKYLGKASRWPEIVAVNPGLAPEKLKYGRTIKIPVVETAPANAEPVKVEPAQTNAVP